LVNNVKLTDEQVEEILSNVNLKLVSGEYVNARTKLHVIDENGYQALTTLVTLKNGISNVAKFHQDNPYVVDNLKIHFEKIGATITPINFYIKDKRAQLEAVCKNGHTFHTKWRIGSNYANTCPECIDLPLYNIEDVKAEISKINPDVIIHSDTCKNSNIKLDTECKVCGHKWGVTYSNLKLGTKCPKCAKTKLGVERALSIDEVKKRVYDVNPNIIILDNEYKNNHHKLNCYCVKHDIQWKSHLLSLKKGSGCKECRLEKIRERHYGIKLFLKTLKEVSPHITLLDNDYVNQKSILKCHCSKHNEEFIAKGQALLMGVGCDSCKRESRLGENGGNWQGGLTPLINYFRRNIKQWKLESMEFCNYKCIITNKRFDDIHHLYSFTAMLKESLLLNKLDIYENISYYSQEQLDRVTDTLNTLHKKYGYGACLTREIHKDFHDKYGYKDNTPEQFYEYVKIYHPTTSVNLYYQ